MKKIFRRLTAGLLAAAALALPVQAADFTACADRLHDMNLFYGTGSGYDLDREPSRAEASAMLVRLLGKEAEAQTGKYTSPFTDVPAWAKNYVGWLYQKGLTYGVGGNKFGSNDKVTTQMMSAFLLRSLGYYESKGDFTFAGAVSFAQAKGVADCVNTGRDFTRDEMVAMSYTALSRPTRSGASSLLSSLVNDGAIRSDAAASTLSLFRAYRDYETAYQSGSPAQKATRTVTAITGGGKTYTLSTLGAADRTSGRYAAETYEADRLVHACYYADGTLYEYSNGKQTSRKESAALLTPDVPPISMVRTVSKSGQQYTIACDPAASARWLEATVPAVTGTVSRFSLTTTFDDGMPRSEAISADLTVGGQSASLSLYSTVTATGSAVNFSVPRVITIN